MQSNPEYTPKTVWQPVKCNVSSILAQTAICYEACKRVTARPFFMLCALSSLSIKDRTYTNAKKMFPQLGINTQCAQLCDKLSSAGIINKNSEHVAISTKYTRPINSAQAWSVFLTLYPELEPRKILFLCALVKEFLGFTMQYSSILDNTKHICTHSTANKYVKELTDAGYLIRSAGNHYSINQFKINEMQIFSHRRKT